MAGAASRTVLDRVRAIQFLPLYPTLVAVAFVIDVLVATHLDPALLPRPLAIAITIGVVVTILAVALVRDRYQGGVVAGLAMVAILGGDDIRIAWLAFAGIAIVVLIGRRAVHWRRQIPWQSATLLFNLVSAVTVIILLGQAAGPKLAAAQTAEPPRATAPPAGASAPPDIVVLLLDGHGRADFLARDYDEDISGFEAALVDRGFDISPETRSNYMTTELTLASMFNLAHLSELELPKLRDPAVARALQSLIHDSEAFRLLRASGYRIAGVAPGWEGVALRTSDSFIDGGQATDFEEVLIANSILLRTLDVAAPDALAAQIRERIRWNLSPRNWLPAMSSGPDLVFVHVPSPHPPYVFGRDGSPLPNRVIYLGGPSNTKLSDEDRPGAADAYADQLAYIDSLAIAAIDEALPALASDTVVIVMSDHGPDVHLDWDRLDTTDSHERFANFFAARTPGKSRLFGDAPTPVNLFPTLFNAYLGMDLPLKPDTSFVGLPGAFDLVDIGNPDAGS